MDWTDTPEQAEFRAYVRRFFEEKLPDRYRHAPHADFHNVRAVNGEEIILNSASWTGDRLSEDPEIRRAADDWAAALSAEGYVAPAWPRELGGAGFSTREQFIFHEEREKAGAPRVGGTGAMFLGSVLMVHGNEEQRDRYMPAIARGEIEWAQGYSEPGAGSDLASLSLRAERDGDEYVLNGRKWWSSGAPDPRCKVGILMGKTDPTADRHKQQSMVVVPMDADGLKMERILTVFGYDDAPHGHGEVSLTDVRVPAENLLLGEGRGFEIAQGRLGPGRIHHCMRTIGVAERALALMVDRVNNRVAFGRKLADMGSIREDIAKSRIEIDQSRLLTLWAAHRMDTVGNKEARTEIATIKVEVPNMALRVIDRAIQAHGGMGVSQDTFLAKAYAGIRTLRLADGPDQVHMEGIAKWELRKGEKRAAGEPLPDRGL